MDTEELRMVRLVVLQEAAVAMCQLCGDLTNWEPSEPIELGSSRWTHVSRRNFWRSSCSAGPIRRLILEAGRV